MTTVEGRFYTAVPGRSMAKKRRTAKKSKPAGKNRAPAVETAGPAAGSVRVSRRLALQALALAAAVVLAYIPVYQAGFIWDDDDYLTINPLIVNEGGLAGIWDPTSGLNQQYYPMLYTSFLLEKQLWGLEDATGYHVTNVLLHAISAMMLFLILRRSRVPGAWLAAALFALHPVQVDSVAWISERKNILSGFFYFLAAYSYLRYDETDRRSWFGLSALLYALALFSKTVTASLPVALALLLWYRRRPFGRSRLATLGAMTGLGLVMGLVTRAYEYKHVALAGEGQALWTMAERVLVAGRAFWFYPWKIIWPFPLAFTYEPWNISTAVSWQWLFPLSVAAAGGGLFLAHRRGLVSRGPVAASLYYALTIFPALGFVQVAYMRYTPVADHFQYLACSGVMLLVAGGLARLYGGSGQRFPGSARTMAVGAVVLVLLGGLAMLTFQHARVYKDQQTLWADAVSKSPGSWLAQLNHGVQLKRGGDLERAAACFERAIRLQPPGREASVAGYANLSSIRVRQDRHTEALAAAERCLELNAGFPLALFNKARALRRLGRPAEAEPVLLQLLGQDFDPDRGRVSWDVRRRFDNAAVYAVLAGVRADLGRTEEALADYRRALEGDPGNAAIHAERIRVLTRQGETGHLIAALREAERSLADPTPFRMQLAWLLATVPDADLRDGEQALALASSLVERLGPRHPLLLSTLAAAQAETGRFEAAAQTARRGLDAVAAAGDRQLASRLQAQARAYAAGRTVTFDAGGAGKAETGRSGPPAD